MDRNKLEIELGKFCQASKSLPVIIEGLSEAYPGVSDTSFTVHVKVEDWGNGLTCSEILDKILPILFVSTSRQARQFIFSFDVYNAVDGFNCHHLETYTEFKLAC